MTFLLLLPSIPRKFAVVLLFLSIVSHLLYFIPRYQLNFFPSADPSILHNELAAIDWVYKKADGKGFYVYNYLPSVYDFPYQYLFWWYGRKHYGYVPCEYASFPGAPGLVIPSHNHYQTPKRPCPQLSSGQTLRFLIIEPDEHTDVQKQWLEAVEKNTKLIEEAHVGTIQVEKRVLLRDNAGL